jgi:Beta-ketoacyl synthase, N-terminal domain
MSLVNLIFTFSLLIFPGFNLIVGPICHRTAPSHRVSVRVSASVGPDGKPQFGKGAAKRVVITGMGVVSSLGHDPDEMYDNLLAGKSGISLIEGFDACK